MLWNNKTKFVTTKPTLAYGTYLIVHNWNFHIFEGFAVLKNYFAFPSPEILAAVRRHIFCFPLDGNYPVAAIESLDGQLSHATAFFDDVRRFGELEHSRIYTVYKHLQLLHISIGRFSSLKRVLYQTASGRLAKVPNFLGLVPSHLDRRGKPVCFFLSRSFLSKGYQLA